eukprot:snap_masked-scaffold_3-processed-gene-0.30-mRNA-1 protein AED:1.00 eAED:1.00 QI:0/0/0/0/1/1/2/0/76
MSRIKREEPPRWRVSIAWTRRVEVKAADTERRKVYRKVKFSQYRVLVKLVPTKITQCLIAYDTCEKILRSRLGSKE